MSKVSQTIGCTFIQVTSTGIIYKLEQSLGNNQNGKIYLNFFIGQGICAKR